MLMDTAPIHPPVTRLSAVSTPADEYSEAVASAVETIKVAKWRNVVVHTTAEGLDADRACHFVIAAVDGSDGTCIRPTELWNRQVGGPHVAAPGHDWSLDTIGICLVGDFSSQPPTQRQFEALVGLVRALQQTCGITAERIYLAREIDPPSGSPGRAFPAKQFNSSLLRPRSL